MLKIKITLLLICGLISSSFAQLATGDIAFIGFNADGDSDVSFLALKEIPAQTIIYFCDSEWNGNSFESGEGDLTWQMNNTPLEQGTVITINNLDGEISCNLGTITGGTGLTKNGDALFAYQGDAMRSPSTFLAAIGNSKSSFGQLDGTNLELGFTAIALTETADIAIYNGPRTGIDINGYLSYFNDMNNWLIQDTDSDDDHNDGIGPDLPFPSASFDFSATDNTAPYITSVAVVSSTELKLNISEALSTSSANQIDNYSFSPAITILSIDYNVANNTITINHEGISQGIATSITASQLTDLSGNVMLTDYQSNDFFYNATSPELIITEIMYNAGVSFDDDIEFVEIMNAGTNEASLGGLRFIDEGNIDFTLPELTLQPNSILLLATNKAVADTFYNATFIDMVASSGNMLGNGGELLQILNTSGDVIMQLEYDDASPWPTKADGAGSSLELLNSNKAINDATNWTASDSLIKTSENIAIFATPGQYTLINKPSICFDEEYVFVSENESSITINISLTDTLPTDCQIDVQLIDALTTATPNDFSFKDSSFVFKAGANDDISLTIPITDNSIESMDKMIVLQLNNPNGLEIGAIEELVIYIMDDEESAKSEVGTLGAEYKTSYLVDAEGSAEIVAFDKVSQRLFVLNSIGVKVEVLDFSDPLNMRTITSFDMSSYGARTTSIATQNGIVVATVENGYEAEGKVIILDTVGNYINTLTVGNLPDMVCFSPDGNNILTANEGQPNEDYSIDPEGSISIIDISAGVENTTQDDVSLLTFNAFDNSKDVLIAQGVRIYGPDATVSQDMEPEYITVADDSKTAWVTLQENNAIGTIDIENKQIVEIRPLGVKDYSLAENALDVSDKNDSIIFSSWNIKGMYMPDAIAHYTINDKVYLVTANEGDQREYGEIDEGISIGDASYILDEKTFPGSDILKKDFMLGRLATSPYSGDTDGDGDFDEIHTFGARSFSIWDAETGDIVSDSGNDFEKITANNSIYSSLFNASNSNNKLKNRSDNKGPEPEGITTAEIANKIYAFITLERTGGLMIYDITDPALPIFEQYLNNRVLGDDEGGDLGPEGIIYISANDSPSDTAMILMANEVSSTISVYYLTNDVVTTPTSIEDAISNPSVKIYPNPAKGSIYFNDACSVKLYNTLGQELIQAESVTRLDISEFESGIYYIQIAETTVHKLIIE